MAITIDNDSAITAFKAELLKSLTAEQREKILSDAIGQILELKKERYGGNDFRTDAMRQAISSTLVDVVKDVLATPENQAKLRAAAEGAVNSLVQATADNLTAAVAKTIRGY